jgi:solute carrier family 25 (mitochondrial phosphate transporter), member 23/24/25/41
MPRNDGASTALSSPKQSGNVGSNEALPTASEPQHQVGEETYGIRKAQAVLSAYVMSPPPAVQTLFAGAVAGAVSRSIVSPFERLKILQQTQFGPTPKYVGIMPSLRLILKEEGIRGYFRGNWANVLRIAPTSAFQFYFYDAFLKLVQPDASALSSGDRLIAGGLAGGVTLALTYPLEFIRGRLTVQTEDKYRSLSHAFRSVVRKEGVLTLYKGLWPSLLGIVPYVGMDFAAFYTFKSILLKDKRFCKDDGSLSAVSTLSCGGLAGALAQTVSYPLDLIRRRMQVQDFVPGAVKYKGVSDAVVSIIRAEGWAALYKGLAANYCKVPTPLPPPHATVTPRRNLRGCSFLHSAQPPLTMRRSYPPWLSRSTRLRRSKRCFLEARATG